MNIIETKIKDVLIIEPQVFADDRGYFFESYQYDKYKNAGIDTVFVQDNESKSNKDVIRGLHMQREPMSQGKLTRIIKGRVWDVVVDCRPESETYGQYIKVELSEDNKRQLWIPKGLAHGFEVMEDNTILSYKCDNYWSKECEISILYNDSNININWETTNPILSEKDQQGIAFKDLKQYL